MVGPETYYSGGCFCGAVRYEYEGPENWVGHCHCESCRRNCSAPFTTFVGVPRDKVRMTGAAPAVYESSPGVRRLFCARCGTPVAIDLLRQLRAEAANPILLLTPRGDEAHLLEAYAAGADECITQPVGPALFLAKVRAWLRRSWTVPEEALETLERWRRKGRMTGLSGSRRRCSGLFVLLRSSGRTASFGALPAGTGSVFG